MAVAVCSLFGSQLSKEFLLRQMYVYHCSPSISDLRFAFI